MKQKVKKKSLNEVTKICEEIVKDAFSVYLDSEMFHSLRVQILHSGAHIRLMIRLNLEEGPLPKEYTNRINDALEQVTDRLRDDMYAKEGIYIFAIHYLAWNNKEIKTFTN